MVGKGGGTHSRAPGENGQQREDLELVVEWHEPPYRPIDNLLQRAHDDLPRVIPAHASAQLLPASLVARNCERTQTSQIVTCSLIPFRLARSAGLIVVRLASCPASVGRRLRATGRRRALKEERRKRRVLCAGAGGVGGRARVSGSLGREGRRGMGTRGCGGSRGLGTRPCCCPELEEDSG